LIDGNQKHRKLTWKRDEIIERKCWSKWILWKKNDRYFENSEHEILKKDNVYSTYRNGHQSVEYAR